MFPFHFQFFEKENFIKKDCELLGVRDLTSPEELFKVKKNKNGEDSQKFSEVKNALHGLKEEYEEELKERKVPPNTVQEARFLISFLVKKYQAELSEYVNSHDSKAFKWLQDALKKANKSPQTMTDRLGVFKKLLPCMVDRSVLDSLKLLSKNGIACFNATCINVVLRELLVRYVQFKTGPSSLAFTEDEKEFYEKMINLENSTGSWLQNAIYQVNTNPQNSKPIKLDTDDAHIPEDEPSRLHQYSFILRVLQALGCSAQQVNIRVGMVFEGEILLDSSERRYTQTTENARGPLSNNRWKVYEFIHSKTSQSNNNEISEKALHEKEIASFQTSHALLRDQNGPVSSKEELYLNKIEEELNPEDYRELLSILIQNDKEDDDTFLDKIVSMLNETEDYSISSLDEVFQSNPMKSKTLSGKKRSFREVLKDEEATIIKTISSSPQVKRKSPFEKNSSPPKRFRETTNIKNECLNQGVNLPLNAPTSYQFLTGAQCRVIKQDRDGHCFFHSMSYYYPSEYNNGFSLRKKICDFLAENKELHINDTSLKDWVFMSRLPGHEDDNDEEEGRNDAIKEAYYEEYLQKMRRKAYGGDIELRIFSHLKKVNIDIYKRKNRGYERIANFDYPGSRTTIRLLFSERIKHY
eukprot:gene6726-7247_t